MKLRQLNALPKAKLQFIKPMYDLSVQKLPEGKEWLYEVKFDSYGCLVGRDATGGRVKKISSPSNSRR